MSKTQRLDSGGIKGAEIGIILKSNNPAGGRTVYATDCKSVPSRFDSYPADKKEKL
jgi:hypothetical protein